MLDFHCKLREPATWVLEVATCMSCVCTWLLAMSAKSLSASGPLGQCGGGVVLPPGDSDRWSFVAK